MMKRIICSLIVCLLLATSAHAFLYEVKILTDDEIHQMLKEELMQVYIDAMIERRASETFHGRAGFSPKEYESFKELLSLIVRLRQEMSHRGMDVPPVEEWLR